MQSPSPSKSPTPFPIQIMGMSPLPRRRNRRGFSSPCTRVEVTVEGELKVPSTIPGSSEEHVPHAYRTVLFTDSAFPPDKSSLTYVYSGDDKYERMVFKRPKDLVANPRLYSIGEVCKIPLPWKLGMDRNWFRVALAVVSVNPKYLEHLIPGLENFEQTFGREYMGSFRFRLWRFGHWVDVIVDDFLPVLDGSLAYFPLLEPNKEFWAALLEKAYAKCHKAYEAIEVGNPVNAITDLSGAICEHFVTQPDAPPSHFHTIYKSSVNRSLIIGIRSMRILRGESRSSFSDDGKDGAKLYIITAATKFLLRDGQMIEMLRLHDLFYEESWWQGEFSLSHSFSWNRVNPTFLESYRPRECLQADEFWITYRDFCYHFCDFIICSATDPYEGPGKHVKRCKETDLENDNKPTISVDNAEKLFMPKSENITRISSAFEPRSQHQLGVPVNQNVRRASIEITVRENNSTVKVDNVLEPPEIDTSRRKSFSEVESGPTNSNGSSIKTQRDSIHNRNRASVKKEGVSASTVYQQLQQPGQTSQEVHPQGTPPSTSKGSTSISRSASRSASSSRHGSRQGSCHSSVSGHSSNYSGSSTTNLIHTPLSAREMSIGSNMSGASSFSAASSESGSIFSVSDIKIKVKGIRRKSAPCRPKSVPSKTRSTSIPFSPSSSNLFDAHVDNFQSRGGWREIVRQHGQWTKTTAGGSRIDMASHSRNPRFLLTLTQADAVNEITPTCARGKCHMLASVMQDYRQGARTAHSMLSTIGFCIYRCKNQEKPEKDERRNLTKLTFIDDIKSEMESREITSRLDLDPGSYFLVPYTMEAGQCGDFLVRILGEKDEAAAKTACVVS